MPQKAQYRRQQQSCAVVHHHTQTKETCGGQLIN